MNPKIENLLKQIQYTEDKESLDALIQALKMNLNGQETADDSNQVLRVINGSNNDAIYRDEFVDKKHLQIVQLENYRTLTQEEIHYALKKYIAKKKPIYDN